MIGELKIVEIVIGRSCLEKIKIISIFEPVEDKPGYYWFNKRNYEIISEEVLKKAIDEYNDKNKDQLLLPNQESYS